MHVYVCSERRTYDTDGRRQRSAEGLRLIGIGAHMCSYVETRARAIACRSLSRLSLRNGAERSDYAHERIYFRMHVRHEVHRSFAFPDLNHTYIIATPRMFQGTEDESGRRVSGPSFLQEQL